jgi:hypothetical protein
LLDGRHNGVDGRGRFTIERGEPFAAEVDIERDRGVGPSGFIESVCEGIPPAEPVKCTSKLYVGICWSLSLAGPQETVGTLFDRAPWGARHLRSRLRPSARMIVSASS